jgi:voltage-gated potassium channel
MVILVGTVGYSTIENLPLVKALYFAVITISTVGYGEPHPLSSAGELFTIFLIISGIVVASYTIGSLTSFVVEGHLHQIFRTRRMERSLSRLTSHYIVCGYGRTGHEVVRELVKSGVSTVIIERDLELVEEALLAGFNCLHGDATQDESLLEGRIKDASGIVASLASDADNVFVIMSAKGLNPDILAVSRANEPGAENKLFRAGADKVISLHKIGGARMAAMLLKPELVNFLDVLTLGGDIPLHLDQVEIAEGSRLAGLPLKESKISEETSCVVIGIKKSDGQMLTKPEPDLVLDTGDLIFILGEESQLHQLTNMAGG